MAIIVAILAQEIGGAAHRTTTMTAQTQHAYESIDQAVDPSVYDTMDDASVPTAQATQAAQAGHDSLEDAQPRDSMLSQVDQNFIEAAEKELMKDVGISEASEHHGLAGLSKSDKRLHDQLQDCLKAGDVPVRGAVDQRM